MDGGTRREAWKRAAFLHEREVPGAREASPEQLLEAGRRLEAWRQSTLGDAASFTERLRGVGLDEASFLRRLVLGEARAETLGWADRLRELLEDAHAALPLPPFAGPPRQPRPLRMPGFTRRFLQWGLARLRTGVEDVARRRGVTAPLVAPGAETELLEALEQRLLGQAARTLVLELNVARVMGHLAGATSAERFEDYARRYVDRPEVFATLLEEYPVLARLLVTTLGQWVETSLELVERLAEDRARLGEWFLAGGDVGALESVRPGAGDLHRAGRSVALLTFGSGLRLVYKPRSLEIEARYQHLLGRLNAGGVRHGHRVFQVLDRGDYGWVEFVRAEDCGSPEAVARFYWRQGSHLALLHLLRAVDFHYGNLLAAGEYPVLVDLEGLFHPRPPLEMEDSALRRTAEMLDRSVLSIGLLPTLFFGRDGRAGVDLSGLGGAAGQLYPHEMARVEDPHQDTMRMVRGRGTTPGADNRPRLGGEDVDAARFSESIVQGFEETYLWLVRHRDAVRAWLEGFAEAEVRFIARPTMRYGFLLQESHHPDFLRDALERDRALDKLWAEASLRPALQALVPSEHEDLRLGDIPVFTARPGQRHLWDSRGRRVAEDYFSRSSLEESLRQLEGMDAAACAAQVSLIRQSMVTIDRDREGRHPKGPPVPLPREPARPAACLAAAVQLGEHLASTAIEGPGDVCWVGVSVQDVDEWRWMLAPLNTMLYDGVGGVALFLGYLAALTGREDFRALARKAVEPVRRQWRSPGLLDTSVGAFSGRGSHLYVLSHLAGVLGEPALLEEVLAGLGALEALIAADVGLDVSGGVAGCALVLLRLYRQTGHPEALRLAHRCGERLLEQARPDGQGGLAWKIPASARELSGLAHGAAGFAWALLELAAATGDERLRDAALRALTFEQTLFSPAHGNWRDMRALPGSEAPAAETYLTAWCNGAAGVALARLLCLPYLDDARMREEIFVGLDTVVREGFGASHCLCHGDVGNLEILYLAGERMGDAGWKHEALRRAAAVLAQGQRERWRCGLPRYNETPGLMLGLAGIGLGLLRLAAPEFVPSVLALEPVRPRSMAR